METDGALGPGHSRAPPRGGAHSPASPWGPPLRGPPCAAPHVALGSLQAPSSRVRWCALVCAEAVKGSESAPLGRALGGTRMEAGPGSSLFASGRPPEPSAPLLASRGGEAGAARETRLLVCVFTAADELAVKPQWRCRKTPGLERSPSSIRLRAFPLDAGLCSACPELSGHRTRSSESA